MYVCAHEVSSRYMYFYAISSTTIVLEQS